MKLTEFIESASYLDYLDELDKQLISKIDRNEKVHAVIINLLNKWLNYASLSVSSLTWLVSYKKRGTISYIVKKQMMFTVAGGEKNIVSLPKGIVFPVGHLIEYCLLLKRREHLLTYLTKIKVANAETYAEEITAIFSGIKRKAR